MKRDIRFYLQLLPLGLALVLFVHCAKDSGGSPAAATGYSIVNGQCYQNGTSTVVTPNLCTSSGQYQIVNGQCISTSNGQTVAVTYCQNVGNNGYQIQNGQCYQTSTGTIVSPQLCTQNGNNSQYPGLNNGGAYPGINGGGGIQGGFGGGIGYGQGYGQGYGSQCVGTYYYAPYGQPTPVYCSANGNCRGQTLLNQYGQQQYCQ
jgi:hypothetical protein